MIHIERKPAPPVFGSSIWQREQKNAVEYFTKSLEERRHAQFSFKFFRHQEVRDALARMFHSKCAFCESNYGASQPLGVENFRPKNGAVGLDGKLSRDHYWWLAYEWFNLYLACPECSKSKGSRFPVEGRRASIQAPEAKVRKEKALLLDPCFNHPEDHLIFELQGLVASSTPLGRTTIEVFNLNRRELTYKRQIHAALLRAQWIALTPLIVTEKAFKKNASSLKTALKGIQDLLQPEREFLALSRQCLQQWSVELTEQKPWLESTFAEFFSLRTGISLTPAGEPAPPTPEAFDVATKERVTLMRPIRYKTATSKDVKKQIRQPVKGFKEHEKEQASYSLSKASDQKKFFSQTRYIESVEIRNFKVIKHIKLNFAQTPDAGSWLLILGENGTGKSSLLQAVAIALMGDKERERLGVNDGTRLATYPRTPNEVVKGFVKVKLSGGVEPIKLEFSSNDPQITTNAPEPKVLLLGYSATRLLPFKGARLTKGSRFSKTDNLFNPSLALTKSSTWLHQLEPPTRFYYVEESLKRLMMLKAGDHLSKTNDGRIQVKAFGGSTVYLEDLSAGYQSVVALSTDIMSVLLELWDSVSVAEGIVLIDEIDAHLHPRWKMQIVERLRKTFPRVQFFVTSHEPLSLRGLNQKEVAVMTRSARGRVSMMTDELPNPKALRVDQLLPSEYFGLSSTLSPELEVEFNEYYALLAIRKRTPKQEERVKDLKTKLDQLRLMGDTPRERMMYEVIDEFLALKKKRREKPEKLDRRTRNTLLKMWQEV